MAGPRGEGRGDRRDEKDRGLRDVAVEPGDAGQHEGHDRKSHRRPLGPGETRGESRQGQAERKDVRHRWCASRKGLVQEEASEDPPGHGEPRGQGKGARSGQGRQDPESQLKAS